MGSSENRNNDKLIGILFLCIVGYLFYNGYKTELNRQFAEKDQQIQILQTQLDAFKSGVIYGKWNKYTIYKWFAG